MTAAVVVCGGVIIMADETNCCSMTDLRWWQTSDSLRGYRFAVGDDTGELIPAMDGHGTFRCLGPKMMMNWGPYNFGQSHM